MQGTSEISQEPPVNSNLVLTSFNDDDALLITQLSCLKYSSITVLQVGRADDDEV